ncbi:DUF2357 domain-containing protein [Paraglaciecola sp. MB-3u-78]|uniref:DUF2357 domain-containing protein n=1 Tax=Paraglaciecola sp. MB-3u-78 TaxID=2058332 RepID=UPI002101DD66|nr:DUF2357 domain-containing protein [Paraglaciecola sp. MB-3u-78]
MDTANNIGWFRLELVYQFENETYRQSFSFEVLPTKIDLASDFQKMNQSIDEEYPLWRFSLAEKTQHQMKAVKQPHSQFLLLWLAQFESLWLDLEKGLKQVVNAPHSRLVATHRFVNMDRLKGRLTPKLEQAVNQAKENRQWDKRFRLDKKVLSVDTPENRFIKSVVSSSISKLTKIVNQLQENQLEPDKQRISESFFNQLGKWQASMRFFQRQPMFKEVGNFTGLSSESLVLQQKPGYARVYKIWQQLKWYLELLQGQNNLSLRSISELYEIWCFLEVRRILLELGFEQSESARVAMVNNGIEVSMQDGMKGAFSFKRDDGVEIRLAHEPKFNKNGSPIKSWTTTQIPDILLEVTFVDGQQFVWIFDAKYRIKKDSNKERSPIDQGDLAPDDAINQMHRYRDALIHQNQSNYEQVVKSRPVFWAFALYPGFHAQTSKPNPYEDPINEIGIGAFSLLPSESNEGSYWLTEFLAEKLGRAKTVYDKASSDKHFVEESPRISYRGTSISRFTDLTIAANQLGPNRNELYVNQFNAGKAKFYHTRVAAFKRQKIEQHIVIEARYLAVALTQLEGQKREIKYLYPIIKAEKVKRGDISIAQAGAELSFNGDELYWLFTLGESLILKNVMTQDWDIHFKLNFMLLHLTQVDFKGV